MEKVTKFIKNNVHFSKAGLSLFGLAFGRAIAQTSFLGFFIVLLENKLNSNNLRHDVVITNTKDCISLLLASVIVYATRRRFRFPFVLALVTNIIFLAGIVILYLVSLLLSDGFIFVALVLLSLERSGKEFMNEFLSDYLARDSEEEQVKNDKKLPIERRDTWLFIAKFLGFLIGGLVVSSTSIEVILMTSAGTIAVGCVFFMIYSMVEKLPREALQDQNNENNDLRPLVKLLPLWAPFLIYYVVDAAGNTLFIEQAKSMDISQPVLYLIEILGGPSSSWLVHNIIRLLWINITNLNMKERQRRVRLTKITCGMFICFWWCVDVWRVDTERSNITSITLVVPQFVLLGTMRGLIQGTMESFFCDQVEDESLHHLESVFNNFVEGIGNLLAVIFIFIFHKWIQDTVDNSHLDKYYRTLAILNLFSLLVFVYLSNTYYWKENIDS